MYKVVLSLTLFRILAAPIVLISVIFIGNYWLAFWLFNFAALTDFLDGKLARDYNVVSRIGALLDPIGDKFLTLFALISIIATSQNSFITFVGALILGREFWVSALREYSSFKNISDATSVTFIAKNKTFAQFIAISMYFLGEALNVSFISFLANFALVLSALLAYKSAIDYSTNVFKSDLSP